MMIEMEPSDFIRNQIPSLSVRPPKKWVGGYSFRCLMSRTHFLEFREIYYITPHPQPPDAVLVVYTVDTANHNAGYSPPPQSLLIMKIRPWAKWRYMLCSVLNSSLRPMGYPHCQPFMPGTIHTFTCLAHQLTSVYTQLTRDGHKYNAIQAMSRPFVFSMEPSQEQRAFLLSQQCLWNAALPVGWHSLSCTCPLVFVKFVVSTRKQASYCSTKCQYLAKRKSGVWL